MIKQLFTRIKQEKNSRRQANRNRATLQYLQRLGFSMPEIRKALLNLNGIRLRHMVSERATFGTLSRTVRGQLHHTEAQLVVAEKLHLDIQELFPHG